MRKKPPARGNDRFVVDTSALISLASVKLLRRAMHIADFVVPQGVLAELEDISRKDDKLGKAAREILEHKDDLLLMDVEVMEKIQFLQETDNECFNLAERENLVLVTDDVRAVYHIAGRVETRFSTFFLVALIELGLLSKREGLSFLEKLRDVRSWENNIIYVKTRKLIEGLF